MPKCPICDSQSVNKNKYGFECLKCNFQNNKEYLNEKIKKGEIEVVFVEAPKKVKKKQPKKEMTKEDWIKKINEEIDKAEKEFEEMSHDSGEITAEDLGKFAKKNMTKFKHIRDFVKRLGELDKQE